MSQAQRNSKRQREEYKARIKACGYTAADLGYIYNRHFCPDPSFHLFLAPRRDGVHAERGRTRGLSALMPDTLVSMGDGVLRWMYTDKKGDIAYSSVVKERDVLRRLGNRQFAEDIVVLMKKYPFKQVRAQYRNGEVRRETGDADCRLQSIVGYPP